jgi:hypothetical protein
MLAACCLLGAAASAAGPVVVKRATSGGVVAELSYRVTDNLYDDVRLRITRHGVVRHSARVAELSGETGARPAVSVRKLDGGEPVVILDYSTGGAYCCAQSQLFRYDVARRSYRRLDMDWASLGYRLVDLDKDLVPEFASGDTRLDQYFTAHVLSSTPIRIWRYRGGRLLDVTRTFPAAIRAHLAEARRTYNEVRKTGADDMRGVMVAYAGDLCLLDRCAEAKRLIADARARGEFDRDSFGPAGIAYVTELLSLLRRTGYLTG